MDFMKRAASMLFDIKRLRLQGCFRANSLIFWEDSLDDSDYKDRSHLLISSSRLNFWYYIIFLIEEFKEMKYKIVNYEYRETAWIKWGLFPMSRKDLKVEIWNIFFLIINLLKLKWIKWKFTWKLHGELHRICILSTADSYGPLHIYAKKNASVKIWKLY